MRGTFERKNGIALIALVVTIIVLLILAGVSITMLTGQNGILNRAKEAKENTEVAQAEEDERMQRYEKIINSYAENLPVGEGTTPYLPNSTFSYKEGDLSTGLVIKDSNDNEYVWVEVPTTIYTKNEYNNNGMNKPNSSSDYNQIEKCLKNYTADYSDANYGDTNLDFLESYQKMLKSVYENGGFWIGRYEAGINVNRTALGEATTIPVVKPNMYPYNYITRNQAQKLSEEMNYDKCTSSLIFGLQWDLILKHIEVKKISIDTEIKSKLKEDSKTIGNYKNNLWDITNPFAKYSNNYGSTFDNCPYKKENSEIVLLTTGADKIFSIMNIYDLVGNVREWTLEFGTEDGPCVSRGGSYPNDGSSDVGSNHVIVSINRGDNDIGFRIGLWK